MFIQELYANSLIRDWSVIIVINKFTDMRRTSLGFNFNMEKYSG